MTARVRPAGCLAQRPLHFIWICDCSGSMSGDKIQAWNTAIRDALPLIQDEANKNPNAQVLVRVVRFSSGAQWHHEFPTPIEQFQWSDLRVVNSGAKRDMGQALRLVAEEMKMERMEERALPPVLVLVSDGQPTDDFGSGLKALTDEPWGKKAVKVAIAIGRDADTEVLHRFMGSSPELLPLQANNPDQLVTLIKWASTAVLESASHPQNRGIFTGPASEYPPSPQLLHRRADRTMETMTTRRRPGGEMASRPLHFIWICDCSGSMSGDKIQALNTAIRDALPLMQDEANKNPNAQVLVRVVRFSSGAQWHQGMATPLEQFQWSDLKTDGTTAMGQALRLVAEEMKMERMGERALPPVLVLISDGQPTDDFGSGLKALTDEPWGKKAVKVAIAIGRDADTEVLHRFMGSSPELLPLQASNPDQLVTLIKWASTAVLGSASAPASQTVPTVPGQNVPIPTPPPIPASGAAADDVW